MPRPLKDFAVAGGGLLSLSHRISRSNDRFCGAYVPTRAPKDSE